MRSFLTPPLDDPWRDWKINPVGNALALYGIYWYIAKIVVPIVGGLVFGIDLRGGKFFP